LMTLACLPRRCALRRRQVGRAVQNSLHYQFGFFALSEKTR